MNRRAVLGMVAVALPLLFGSAACGGSSSAKASAPAGKPQGGTQGAGDLPAGFPVPSGAQTTTSKKSDGQILVALKVTSGADAYNFWWQQLPSAGYTILDKNRAAKPELALLQFKGNGWLLGRIAINGNAASVILTK